MSSCPTNNHLEIEVVHAWTTSCPATLHRKLDELREGGLIEQTFEGKNRRTKFLVPTKAANAYFDRMSGAMQSAVNS